MANDALIGANLFKLVVAGLDITTQGSKVRVNDKIAKLVNTTFNSSGLIAGDSHFAGIENISWEFDLPGDNPEGRIMGALISIGAITSWEAWLGIVGAGVKFTFNGYITAYNKDSKVDGVQTSKSTVEQVGVLNPGSTPNQLVTF